MENISKFNVQQLGPNTYDNTLLIKEFKNKKKNIVIYGSNKTGQLALCAFKKLKIKVGKEFFGIKILSPLEIFNIDKNAIIFISHPQIENGVKTLTDLGFKNIYTCIDLWKFHDFNNSESLNFLDNINPTNEKITGHIDYHKYNVLKYLAKLENDLTPNST